MGFLEVRASAVGICEVNFAEVKSHDDPNDITSTAVKQLADYFVGRLDRFDLPLCPAGTEFQQTVWRELQKIPFGETRSYLDLALKCGGRTYTRAVGLANGKNPIAVIIPCHRVVGNKGDLTGYAGGLQRKKWLLAHEAAYVQLSLF